MNLANGIEFNQQNNLTKGVSMGFFKLKQMLAGLAIIGTASGILADAWIDQTFEDNQNDFEFYWYYYDDNAGVGPNDRPAREPEGTPSIINVEYTEKERHAFDDPADTWMVKQYRFQTGEHMSRRCAVMPFTFGDTWVAGYCDGLSCAEPYVAIGCMLTGEGQAIDLTGVTSIKFYIKSRVNELNAVVKLQTLDIDTYSQKPGDEMEGDEFGYYGKTISFDNSDWQLKTIDIEDLQLPGDWAHDFDFDITQCTKFAIEIKYAEGVTVDTVDLAEVQFVGTYEFVSPSMWIATETSLPSAPRGDFADFDQAPYNQAPAPVSTYWYAYNDVEISGTSSVLPDYATQTESGRLALKFIANSGSNNSQGAALGFILGAPIPKDTITIAGFVGIGCNLYDSADCVYFNGDSATNHTNSVYFEYTTDGNVKGITLELSDINDVGDAANPSRKESRGSGIVYYRNFPPTAPEVWNKVLIPFDSLVIHDSWEGYNPIPFDKTKLAKIQWKVQGAEGTNGLFAIDNVCFPGADFGRTTSVLKPSSAAVSPKAAGLFAVHQNNKISVNWSSATQLSRGKVSLINTRGAVVASAKVANGAKVTSMSASRLPAGMYFVRLNAIDTNGKTVSMHSPLTVVK